MPASISAADKATEADEYFESEWARCAPWIEAALEYTHGTNTIDDIKAGVLARTYQFWPGKSCAIITEVLTYPRFSVCHFFLGGGDLTEIMTVFKPLIEAWAKSAGCSRITIAGRRGWERVLTDYDRMCVVLGKDL